MDKIIFRGKTWFCLNYSCLLYAFWALIINQKKSGTKWKLSPFVSLLFHHIGEKFFNIHKVFVEIYYRNFRKDKFPRQWYSASSHDIKWAQWPNFNKKVFFSPCIFCTDLMIIILHQLYTTAGYWKNTNKDFLFNNKILQYNV